MKKLAFVLAASVGFFVGLGLVLPAVALWRDYGVLRTSVVVPLLGGTLMMLCGLAAGAAALRQPRP